jgi:hypothetical protein
MAPLEVQAVLGSGVGQHQAGPGVIRRQPAAGPVFGRTDGLWTRSPPGGRARLAGGVGAGRAGGGAGSVELEELSPTQRYAVG